MAGLLFLAGKNLSALEAEAEGEIEVEVIIVGSPAAGIQMGAGGIIFERL